jgi:actin-related protein 5
VHDTFGADDGDWAVYKKMDRHASDSEGEEEEAELERIEERLRAVDPETAERSLGLPTGAAPTTTGLIMQTAEDYQLSLTVQRVRVPEVLFQPSIIGVDQVRARHRHGSR